jgi:imidazole glycerol-phosphate synthase subunit HisH
MTSLAIIDYGSGNVRSVARAAEAAAADLDVAIALTADPKIIEAASHILLPGVGHFADCAAGLRERRGVIEAMTGAVTAGRPFLGVCVGMQLMADVGREDVETPGLGWIPGAVERLKPSEAGLPVPHTGWNELVSLADHPVLRGLGPAPHVYFTHSYAMQLQESAHGLAWCDYGGRFPAAIGRDSLFGVQFHPEKSQLVGQRLLRNFLQWRP